eukprot:TRINITY_DN78227_c0_g1_i1.p1 TRINITY_DN78227_c0_g1~~TRINITY_DN78227_c0_g1_i1.p1  ORF type:complete len:690 (+),score=133.75 TRINITY_DN78227_c0_g1_i1:97-2166(+)
MAADPPVAEDHCEERALGEELRRLLEQADAQWRLLEERLEQVQQETLQKQAEDLQQHFGISEADLHDREEGGFAWKVRGRLHCVLLRPLALRMRQQVLPEEESEAPEEARTLVLDDLLDRWELEVEPLLGQATEQDQRLARRARRKAQRGTREVWQVESRERPAAWAPARGALKGIEDHVRRLSAFLQAEVSPEFVGRLAACVPSVIARAVCDWHFRGPLAELEQLENWWEGARLALESCQELWDRLVQEEGVFLRRIDRGVEALRSARQLYLTYADFGVSITSSAGGWPGHLMHLLADAQHEMTSRMRPVRDSAAWRVVDAAKTIQKQLHEGAKQGPWRGVGQQEGVQLFLKALRGQSSTGGASDSGGAGAVDATMVFMGRVNSLTNLLGDTRAALGREDIGTVLDDLLRAASVLSEDLLGVLDEPSDDGLADCVRQWRSLGEECHAADRLEASLSATPLPATGVQRQQLAMLRGLHAFLSDADFRERVASDTGEEVASVAAAGEVTGSLSSGAVDQPPEPSQLAATKKHSPRGGYAGGYAPRRPRFEGEASLPPASPAHDVSAPEAAYPSISAPAVPTLSREALESSRSLAARSRPGTGSTSLRPGTPSWLRPPWQRPDTPSAASWTRPDTPSTAYDDSEVFSLPRWKFVDGQYVPLKSTATRTLPPLQGLQGTTPRGAQLSSRRCL